MGAFLNAAVAAGTVIETLEELDDSAPILPVRC